MCGRTRGDIVDFVMIPGSVVLVDELPEIPVFENVALVHLPTGR
jgi:hypothetical protein